MAKKKTKKNDNITLYLSFGAIASAVIVLVGLFLNNINIVNSNGEVKSAFTGLQLAFGAELTNLDLGVLVSSTGKLNFNFLITLAFILPIIVTVLTLFLGKKKLSSMILGLVSAAVFVFALVVVIKSSAISTVTIETTSLVGGSTTKKHLMEYISADNMKLAFGAILAIIGASLGCVCSLGYTLKKVL